MFDSESRYAGVGTYIVTDARGNAVKIIRMRVIPSVSARFSHKVVKEDRADLLAQQYYRAPARFWRIADANTVMDPAELLRQLGSWILIPAKE